MRADHDEDENYCCKKDENLSAPSPLNELEPQRRKRRKVAAVVVGNAAARAVSSSGQQQLLLSRRRAHVEVPSSPPDKSNVAEPTTTTTINNDNDPNESALRLRPERDALPDEVRNDETTSTTTASSSPLGGKTHKEDKKLADSYNCVGNVVEEQHVMENATMEHEVQSARDTVVENSQDNSVRQNKVIGDDPKAESGEKREACDEDRDCKLSVDDRKEHTNSVVDERNESDQKVVAAPGTEDELLDIDDQNATTETIKLWKSLDEAPLSSDDELLKDTNGKLRGVCITLKEDEWDVLTMLLKVFGLIEKKLGRVQHYTENLLHYNLQSPGFPVQCGSDGYNLFSSCGQSWVLQLEAFTNSLLKNTLIQIGYCTEDQGMEFYLSFLKSLEMDVQPPHIDQKWENAVSPSHFAKKPVPRYYRGNYEEWVPFIALFPLTDDGMTVEVWHARSQHDQPELPEHKVGRLVKIPLGQILLLRADVVHAGGFMTAESGNPRGHFYIYKTPRGASHPLHLSNCYEVKVDGKILPMLNFYEHHPDCADANNVVFARLCGKG